MTTAVYRSLKSVLGLQEMAFCPKLNEYELAEFDVNCMCPDPSAYDKRLDLNIHTVNRHATKGSNFHIYFCPINRAWKEFSPL